MIEVIDWARGNIDMIQAIAVIILVFVVGLTFWWKKTDIGD